ncbi:hypothetical protein AAFF_G00353500 [Aldrovandia affinis]|uniref:Beta/gamma crystallin 'Greek key' domain-containing protein n=1 Tax=Aldrovandia affinis TaxID=143900 RepID=A0AAD7R5L6_9TELE|nr:hypothetical protein AAFF_G00353500 [Aldrovandia affinis]
MGGQQQVEELCPVGWKFHCTPRCGKTGGGVAFVYKDNYTCSMLNCPTFSSFEAQLVKVGSADPLLVITIYRPTDSRVFKETKNFISQFSTFPTDIIPNHDRVLILGDFNIHVDNPIRAFESEFMDLIQSFGLIQHVSGSTRKGGHTLDLVLSLDLPIRDVGTTKAHTPTKFPSAFTAAKNTAGEKPSSDPEELTIMLNFTCQSILDTIAPLTLKKPKPSATPWLNDTTRAQRRIWRQAERRWKKDRLQISLEMLRDSQQTYQKVDRNFGGCSYECMRDCPELNSYLSCCNSCRVDDGCFMVYECSNYVGKQFYLWREEYSENPHGKLWDCLQIFSLW